jgi:uncharacterized protein YciI
MRGIVRIAGRRRQPSTRESSTIRTLVESGSSMHFLLFYTYVPDILERRPQFRGAHVKYAREAVARGELVLGGALADPVDTGVLLFSAASKDVVEKFATNDPYVTGGLVTRWSARVWTTVVGPTAANPLPPDL